jgi:hypothetical protein
VTIEVRLELDDAAKRALLEEGGEGQKVGIPAAVLVDG